MKVKAFIIGVHLNMNEFEKLTSDTNIAIHHIDTVADNERNWAVVYYDTVDSLTDAENLRLAAHQFVAGEIVKDEGFMNLKNQRSRELWLLAMRGVCSADAKDIIELTRGEMQPVREKKVCGLG